jgi:hypothetical protein
MRRARFGGGWRAGGAWGGRGTYAIWRVESRTTFPSASCVGDARRGWVLGGRGRKWTHRTTSILWTLCYSWGPHRPVARKASSNASLSRKRTVARAGRIVLGVSLAAPCACAAADVLAVANAVEVGEDPLAVANAAEVPFPAPTGVLPRNGLGDVGDDDAAPLVLVPSTDSSPSRAACTAAYEEASGTGAACVDKCGVRGGVEGVGRGDGRFECDECSADSDRAGAETSCKLLPFVPTSLAMTCA